MRAVSNHNSVVTGWMTFASRADLREWAGGDIVIVNGGFFCGRGPNGSGRYFECRSPRGRLIVHEYYNGSIHVLAPDEERFA